MSANHKVVVTGSSGLIGTALTFRLKSLGYMVVPYRSRSTGIHAMDASTGHIDLAGLEGTYAVIHLAGETIAQHWTTRAKQRILSSRQRNTHLLSQALASLVNKPEVFISMSGINRYSTSHVQPADESSPTSPVQGFLSSVTEAWENATEPALAAGIRTVWLRTGMVLSRHGGGLQKMLPAFRLGLGGPIGGGGQRMSWIGLPDLVQMILWTMSNPSIEGPLNAVAPGIVTQAEFAQALGKALGRRSWLPLPAWVMLLLFGQMGQETILADLAIHPAKALKAGFAFATPDLTSALRQALSDGF